MTGLVALVVTSLALYSLAGLGIDNSLEIWLDPASSAFDEYETFRQTFGSEEYILILYPCPETVELEFLERLTDLRFELEEIDGVGRVLDLARIYARVFSLEGIEAFREELRTSPLLRNFLISADGRRAASWVFLDPERPRARAEMVAAVESAARGASLVEDPRSIRFAGSAILNAALDRSSRTAARAFFPLVFLLSAAVLLLLFRRLSGVVIPFLSVGTGIVWTLAILRLSGASLNMITVTLPPLVWVLGLSTSIHLLTRWHHRLAAGEEAREAARLTLRRLFRPCLYSSVTTAVGFASLMVSSMQPVREMGLFTSIGILLCFASNFLLFPALVEARMWIPKRLTSPRREHPVLDALVRQSRRPRTLLAIAVSVGAVFVIAIPHIRAESNPIRFFRDQSDLAVTYERVLPGFTGPYSLEVQLEVPAIDVEILERLDALRTWIESREGVARTISILDFLERGHRAIYGLPGFPKSDGDLEDVWRQVEKYPDELGAFRQGSVLRLSVLAQPMGSIGHRRLVDELEHHLEVELDPDWRPRLTGIVPLLVAMQERLVESQIRSFALAFLIIMVVLGLLLRKLSDTLASLVPNLLPILFALGTMGWLGIPLDPATVMIAGVALGIAADDTIHFLVHFRRRLASGSPRDEAVIETIHAVGPPMVTTSLVAALGFLVLCFSSFVPLFHFGLLTAVTMGAALLGDLVALPAILLLASRRRTPGHEPP